LILGYEITGISTPLFVTGLFSDLVSVFMKKS
jgi:hypothetical protein